MIRTLKFVFAIVWATLAASAFLTAQEQTLADRARAARAAKASTSSKKVITNDNLGFEPSPVGAAPSDSAAAPVTSDTSAGAANDAAPSGSSKSAEDIQKLATEWASKINKAKEEIAFLERETTVASRESQIRAAEFYGTAGTRLQNSQKWLEDQKSAQQETENKKKALADAKAKLEQYRDEARRAGVPANQIP